MKTIICKPCSRSTLLSLCQQSSNGLAHNLQKSLVIELVSDGNLSQKKNALCLLE